MMRISKRLRSLPRGPALVALIALVATACGDGRERTGRGGMMDGGMMEMMMRNMPPGIPASELPDPESRGARLVARYCGQCHGIPSPAGQSAADWSPTVRRMVARMEHMASMRGMMGGRGMRCGMPEIEAPEPGEARAILEYLQMHALRPIEGELADRESPGARLFGEVCSRCHALPDPTQHPPEAWKAVVDRMRGNMSRMEIDGITDAQADSIVGYLQRAAAR